MKKAPIEVFDSWVTLGEKMKACKKTTVKRLKI